MALQKFNDENSASLVQLSRLRLNANSANSFDDEGTQNSLKEVFSVIKKLRAYFIRITAKPPEFNDEQKEDVIKKVQEAYKCYDEVIKWWKLQDGEKALFHGLHAAFHIVAAHQIGYKLGGYDFFFFVTSALLAFKLGLCRTVVGLLFKFKNVAESNDLCKKFENVQLFCVGMCQKYEKALAKDDLPVQVWLGNLVSFLRFVTLDNDENELESSKILYSKYSKTDCRMENLRKATLSRIVRSEFVCLINYFVAFLRKDKDGQTIVRVQGNKTHEVKDKLTKLNAYLVEELNAIEENASSYTFLILLISSISYHLLEDYHAAVPCFETTKSAFEKLGEEDPLKLMFDEIKFQKFQTFCIEKLSFIRSDPILLSPIERLFLEEECKPKLSHKHTIPLIDPVDPIVNERQSKEEVAADYDDAVHNEIALKEHEDDEFVVERYFEERAPIEEKYEAHHNVKKVFDWDYVGKCAYNVMKEYNFANVKRSLDNDVEYEEEEGTLIRYRSFSLAKKELHMLKEIEKSCPGGSEFILRAKSSIYKQMVMEGDKCIPVYDFVVERGIPFASWLEDRKKEFNDLQVKEDQRKKEWWKFIKKDVKRLFRGVVRGLWVLSSLNLSFRGFYNGVGIFICSTHGVSYAKMKPCAQEDGFKSSGQTDRAQDIRGLRRILSWVIMSPFQSANVFDFKEKIVNEYALGLEMKMCFVAMGEQILKNTTLTRVKFDHLIDASFFWTKEERIGYLFKWDELAQRSLIPNRIDSHVEFNGYGLWHNQIRVLEKFEDSLEKMEGRVLYAIYMKEVISYKNSKDVVRFGVNTIKHYNSNEYSSMRPKVLTNVQIEAILRAYIPGLYFALVQALSKCIFQRCFQWDHSDVCLKELLSRRFPKGECDKGCSPYVICDHLLEEVDPVGET